MAGAVLRPKQARFVQEYLVDFNGTQAAIRAGYSPRWAKEMAYENLTKPHIASALAKAGEALTDKVNVTQERIAKEWAEVGFAKVAQPVTWDAKARALSELAARAWPVPKMEPERPTAVKVTVVYENDQGKQRHGVKVEVEE